MKVLFEIDLPDRVIAEIKQLVLTKLLSDTEIGDDIVHQFIAIISAPTPLPSKENNLDWRKLSDWYKKIGLSPKSAGNVAREGIYPREILSLTDKEVISHKGIGKTTLTQLRSGLKVLGYDTKA